MRLSPERTVAGALLAIGLATLAVLFWVAHKAASLDRSLDFGDAVVLGVLAAFASFCVWLASLLYREATTLASTRRESSAAAAAAPRRVGLSQGCAAVGVLLLVVSVLLPADWHPVLLLFSGLALLAVSHALTPCVERLEQLRKARESVRQL